MSLECRPALDLVADYGAHPGVLLYVDPPYLGGTRSGLNYKHEMSGEQDHRDLADALCVARASVVISGYDSPLYSEMYAGWSRAVINTATTQGPRRLERTEVLWSNRLFPQGHLFDLGEAP